MAKLTNTPRQGLTLDLERRKSFSLRVDVVNADESPVDLTGCTMRFVLKPASYDSDAFDVTNLIVNNEAELPEPTAGYGFFAFQAAELDQPPGEYFGTIVLWLPSGYSMTLCKVQLNLLENTESDSMHQLYEPDTPMETVEVALRDGQVVSITATNYVGKEPAVRAGGVFTTTANLGQTYGEYATIARSTLRGTDDDPKVGDLIFQEGIHGIGASITNVSAFSVDCITVIVAFRSEWQADLNQLDSHQVNFMKNMEQVRLIATAVNEVHGDLTTPANYDSFKTAIGG